MKKKLTGAQRKWLRGQAHSLKPVVQLGKQGLSEAVIQQVDAALDDHELIKVQAVGDKEEKQEIGARLAAELGAEAVGLIGHILILYRQQPDREKRKIQLPR
ncbi:MAG TPA: ribosome assembly RNA-binding protein YhbY [Thermoanaerobaculia bacterium]|nr:ribosome assembly RNA-binding protein YhbY [Thermoanaerobaculia bacterium]